MTSSANGLVGTGTRLFMAEHGDLAFQEVANVKTTPEVGTTAQQLEITNLDDDNQRYVSGLGAISALTFTVIYKGPDWNKIYQKSGDKVAYDWKLVYPDGMYITFTGAVEIQLEPIDINTAATFNLTITPDNVPRFHKSNSTTDNADNGDDSGGGGNGMSYRPMFVKSFDNVADMNAFDNSDDVLDQGDFVLISSNDGDNGKVYFYNGNGFTYFASIIGPQGDTGAKGDPGTDIKMMGAIDTLPALGQEGQCYFVSTTLYSWSSGKWINLGDFQGPAGKDGTQVDLRNYLKTTDTSNWQKVKITNDDGGNKYSFTRANTTDLVAAIQALPLGYHTFYCQAGVKGNPSSQSVRGIAEITTAGSNPLGVGYFTDSTGDLWSFYVDSSGLKLNNKQDKLGYTAADDSTVVHSTPTILPSGTDLNTVTSTGYYYIPSAVDKPTNADDWTIYQVVSLQKSLENGVQLAFDTNGSVQSMRTWTYDGVTNTLEWKNWQVLATTDDVTTAISAATANMVRNVKGDTSWESIDGFKKFVHKPTDSEGYQFMTSDDVNNAINPLEQKISDTGWQLLVSKDSSSAAFSSSSYYRIVNGILYVHGTITVNSTTNYHYQLWDIPTGWSIGDKAGTQIIYPDSTSYSNYVQLNSTGLLVYGDKTGYSTDFRFVTPVDKA